MGGGIDRTHELADVVVEPNGGSVPQTATHARRRCNVVVLTYGLPTDRVTNGVTQVNSFYGSTESQHQRADSGWVTGGMPLVEADAGTFEST